MAARWDSLEDFLIYGLVMLGIIIVPTAIITGTPLDCNYCQVGKGHQFQPCGYNRFSMIDGLKTTNLSGRLLSKCA